VLWWVVGGIWNNSVCEGKFSENACVHANGGFVDGYVQVVKFIVLFFFFGELQVGVERIEVTYYCVYVSL